MTRVDDLRHRLTHCRFRIGTVEVLHQDNYFLPEPCQQDIDLLNHKNWELISALDMNRMCTDIENLLRREMTFQLSDGKAVQNVINILILEGFTIFASPFILELCNMKVHMHLPYEKCYERRKLRTYDPPGIYSVPYPKDDILISIIL